MRAQARVNVAAIERNVARLRMAAGHAEVCAVVKSDGYGHGMLQSAQAAWTGGATCLAVATADEATALCAGLNGTPAEAAPILILGVLMGDEVDAAVAAGAEVSAWTLDFAAAVERAARANGRTVRLHVKLDSGLGRLGTRDPNEATAVADMIAASDALELAGAWTHFATADEPDDGFFGEQLARFRAWSEPLKARHPDLLLHAANSAATLRDPGSHFDLVRCGVAIYGLDPFGASADEQGLEPALQLISSVGAVKACLRGESIGYGRRFIAEHDTDIATVPIGYGDGYRRALGNRAEVLIAGSRYPVRGTVSMDNITVDVGAARSLPVPGDEVVLIGPSGADSITAEALAEHSGTINYEITCGISARPTRIWHSDGERLPE